MWIDTHTHFDAAVFTKTRAADWKKAQSIGVSAQFVMGVAPFNFGTIQRLAAKFSDTYFCLGIHPMFVMPLSLDSAMDTLAQSIEENLSNPRFIGLGEIGLDGFVDHVDWGKQLDFFTAQLALARDYNLPVFMHVRKAQDNILKYTKRMQVRQGIAHAFNGSEQQANHYIEQGFKLGFGGAVTFERAKKLRRLVATLPLETLVLETDSPDMSPAWAYQQSNYSYHLPQIAQSVAAMRGISLAQLASQLLDNVKKAVPRYRNSIHSKRNIK